MGSRGRRAAGGSAERRAGGDGLGTSRDGLGTGGGRAGTAQGGTLGMATQFPTLLASKGGKAASFPREGGSSVGSRSLSSDPGSEGKQRAFGGAGIYFV